MRLAVLAAVGDLRHATRLGELDPQPVRRGHRVGHELRVGHRDLVVEELDVQRMGVVHPPEERDPSLAERERRLIADVDEAAELGLGNREPEVVRVDRVLVPLLTLGGQRDQQVALGRMCTDRHRCLL